MISKKLIIDAYTFLKTHNQDIPDETLDFIKNTSIAAYDKIENKITNEITDEITDELIIDYYNTFYTTQLIAIQKLINSIMLKRNQTEVLLIKHIDMTCRCASVLNINRIDSLHELTKLTSTEVLNFKGISQHIFKEIENVLSNHNLTFKQS